MNPPIRTLLLTGSLAAALMACSDDTKLDERIVTGETPAAGQEDLVTVFEPLNRSYRLRPEQQEQREAMDMNAFQEEYGRHRDAIVAVGNPGDGESGGATPTSAASAGATATPGASGLRPRGQMDFAYLDRNGDGRLSIAEYAIWAVPFDPGEPKPGDKGKPYLTADQANRTANSFVFYDQDGDGFMQPGEFAVFTATKRS